MPNYQDLLSNLLAVIHADGGHYEAEHGTVKAVTDAIEKVFEMKAHLTQRAVDGATRAQKPNCGDRDCFECNPPRN